MFPGMLVKFVFQLSSVKPCIKIMSEQGQWISCPRGTVLLQLKIQGESGCSHSYLAGQVQLDFNGTVETVKIGDMEKNVYRGFRSRQITRKSSGYLVSLGGLPT